MYLHYDAIKATCLLSFKSNIYLTAIAVVASMVNTRYQSLLPSQSRFNGKYQSNLLVTTGTMTWAKA